MKINFSFEIGKTTYFEHIAASVPWLAASIIVLGLVVSKFNGWW